MMEYIKRRVLHTVAIWIGAALLFSCAINEHPAVEQNYIVLALNVPSNDEAALVSNTKSGVVEPGIMPESSFRTLKFFIFTDANTLETYKEINASSLTDPMWDASTRSMRVLVTAGTKLIYCIANWTDGDSGMDILDDSTVTTIASLNAIIRTHSSLWVLDNPPVMTGSLSSYISGSETTPLKIDMTRQVAKVEVYAKLSTALAALGATITIEGIKFHNLAESSYLYRKTPTASPGTATFNQSVFTGVASPALTHTYTAYDTAYYIPEYVPASPATATIMEIRANYAGTVCYYLITINPSENEDYTHTPYVIERNHIYRYYIEIQGLGNIYGQTVGANRSREHIAYRLTLN